MKHLNCPICKSASLKKYFRLRCNNLSALKCGDCKHIFIENSPVKSSKASNYYTMDDFKGDRKLQNDRWYTNYYRDCFTDYESHLGSSLVLKQFQEKLKFLNLQFPKKGRLLDIGCATGVFLDMARKQGWSVEGIEVSHDLAVYAKEKFSLKVHELDLTQAKLNSEPFDVITLFDVIEHLPQPNLIIEACKELLTSGGILLIRTPMEESLLRDIAKLIYKSSFRKLEFPLLWFYSFEHIQSFSLKSLRTLFKNHDLSIVNVFREEESLDRINIPLGVKIAIKGINFISFLLHKQHKITVIAKKLTYLINKLS